MLPTTRLSDADLVALVRSDAPGRYTYEVNVDEGPMGGLYYVVNADNKADAMRVAEEHAVRIRRQRAWRVYVVARTTRSKEA